ncbi:MAG TPA: TRAP transporter small permease [Syntrophorhabdales bacterium]|nr:TRAP transporter small permease [Syntrophorhabdales bacterium]
MGDLLEDFLTITTKILNAIGGTALTFMMLLTVADVIMRAFGHPLVGTYEIVGLSLALVIGITIPKVSFDRCHVNMEIVLERVAKGNRDILNTFTRLICFLLFIGIGYNLFVVANEFRRSGEVSPTIQLPAYPLAYAVGFCCFIECLVFVLQIIKIWRGEYE